MPPGRRPRYEPHPTETIVIKGKEAAIDKGMVPVVRWLNSFDAVETTYCCEGWHGDHLANPYVLFFCDDPETLKTIVGSLGEWISPYDVILLAECRVDVLGGRLRYKLEWGHTDHFLRWKRLRGFC